MMMLQPVLPPVIHLRWIKLFPPGSLIGKAATGFHVLVNAVDSVNPPQKKGAITNTYKKNVNILEIPERDPYPLPKRMHSRG
jgi:hypothetical protein